MNNHENFIFEVFVLHCSASVICEKIIQEAANSQIHKKISPLKILGYTVQWVHYHITQRHIQMVILIKPSYYVLKVFYTLKFVSICVMYFIR